MQATASPPRRSEPLPTVPAELESANAKLVYLAVATAGTATVGELRTRLDLPKLTLFPLLRRLTAEGLLEREDERYAVR